MSSPLSNSSAIGSPQSSFSFPPSPLFSPPPNPSNSSSHTPLPPPQLHPLPSEPHTAPSPQLNASLADPPTSPLPQLNSPPPSASNVVSPAPVASPPPTSSSPPVSSPPPQPSNPPPTISPPPIPPTESPPAPPPLNPPVKPSPPAPSTPAVPKSPPPLRPPNNAPPPPAAKPPEHSPSPPKPSIGASPPPPLPKGPESSPTPPSAKPPETSPSPPSPSSPFVPPRASTIPPGLSPQPIPPSPNSPRRPQPLPRTPPSIVFLPPPSPHSPSVTPPGNSGNPISSSHSPGRQSANDGGISTGSTVAIALVLGLLLLGIFGTVACCVWKRKKRPPQQDGGYSIPTLVTSPLESDKSLQNVQISAVNNGSGSGSTSAYSPHGSGGLGNSRPWFSYEELVRITNGFSAQNLLGEGGFGSVYKGTLIDGREVAIKQLKIGGRQGEREFKSEVEIISRIHHRHLVSLVGYCISDDQRLLVYDYLPNNTLYFHLHGVDRPIMDWATRVKIAVGAARGIAYLHEDCHPRIIHRDIKSSNILLDNNFEAQVSDFGLAKLAIDTNTHISTRVMGTFGYMAPEYASSGKLTEKSDVYSFGVVLLELITGRKPVDTSQPVGEESLVEWARPLLSHAIETQEFNQLADARLEGNYIDGEMFRLIEVAAACVRHSSSKRPKMGQVLRAIDGLATSDLTDGMKLGESEILNSAQQSEEIRLFRRMAFGSQNYSTSFFNQDSSSSETNREYSRPD